MLARPREHPDPEAHARRERKRKRMRLVAHELEHGLQHGHTSRAGPSRTAGMIHRIGASLLDRLRILFVRVHVRFEQEDRMLRPGRSSAAALSCGAYFERLELGTVTDDGTGGRNAATARLLTLTGLETIF